MKRNSISYKTSKFGIILRAWNSVEAYVGGIGILVGTLIVFYAVFMRYVFKNPPHWAEHTSIILIVWSAFIVSSIIMEENGHIGADFVISKMPTRVQRVVDIVTTILMLGFSLAMTYYGIVSVVHVRQMGLVTFAFNIKVWVAQLAVPVGMFFISLRLVQRLYRLVNHPELVDRSLRYDIEEEKTS